MTLPEDPNQTPPAEQADASAETPPVEFPETFDLPEDFTPLIRPDELNSPSRARRRRARRTLIVPTEDERAALLKTLARRAFPSFEFFLLAALSGALLGLGYLFDAQALLLLGVLVAPLLTAWAGLTLAATTGGWRFFWETFISLSIALGLVAGTSALVGLLGRAALPRPLFQADLHSHLWWPDLLLTAGGAIWMVWTFARQQERYFLPNALLAYAFFLPVAAAGFGAGIGLSQVGVNGLLVVLTHLGLATLLGMATFFALRFKPLSGFGFLMPIGVGLVNLTLLVMLTGLGGWLVSRLQESSGAYQTTPVMLASPTPGLPPSPTPGAPTRTFTPLPSETPTPTLTPTATPVYAVIAASTGGGALVREEPAFGKVIVTLNNGLQVEVLPEIQVVDTIPWVRIRLQDGREGWVLQGVLRAATPVPSATSTLTPTPTR
ncbi:MAG: SH3 domain-containing protein [Anaerolineales bacterium]|nr:SH3 domain-containing protein [Anaerolineales bacterium]MDW8226640.1 SH3 domain-containing protein [Anaerolineales bacterium]